MKNQIIFYAFSSQSWDCYVPIITELIKQEPESEQWMGVYAPCNQYSFRNETSKTIFDRLKQNFKHPRETTQQKSKGYKYVLITTHIPDQNHDLNEGFYIHVPHGSAFGNNLTADYVISCYQASDIYCTISAAEEQYITTNLREKTSKNKKFALTGCPKNDFFADYISSSQQGRAEIKQAIKHSLGIDSKKSIVFLASHWTERGTLRRFGTSLIHALSTLGDQVQIIQGAHPNLWTNHVSSETSTWIYQALCHERDKGTALLSMGTSDAMALLAADVVVGDISSIAIEAALLEKAILLNIDENSFRNQQIYEIYKNMSAQFEGADDLLQKFIHGVDFPKERELAFHKVKEMFGFNLGNASSKVASIILEAKNQCELLRWSQQGL